MKTQAKILWKVHLDEAPVAFENWFETPPLPRLLHIPLERPFIPQEDEIKEVPKKK